MLWHQKVLKAVFGVTQTRDSPQQTNGSRQKGILPNQRRDHNTKDAKKHQRKIVAANSYHNDM